MNINTYDYLDYKLLIKDKIKLLKNIKPKYSLRYLADQLSIQYTFLSKVLNSKETHLSEDHLFHAAQVLDLLHDEIDYLLLLRSYQATSNKLRKNYLFQRISNIQNQKKISVNVIDHQQTHFGDDMKYLMNENAILVHVALWITEFKSNPLLLASYLKVDVDKVKEILDLLARLGLIEYNSKNNQIKKVANKRSHFGKEHPLTRTHQLLMKTSMNQRSYSLSEENKENFFVTFTCDTAAAEKIKKEVKNFISLIQKISFEGKHTGVYQLNLDFLSVINTENKKI